MVSSSRNSELQTYATIIRIVSFDAPSFTYTYNNCLSSRYQPFRKHPGSTTTALPSPHSYTSAQVPTKSSPPPQRSHTQKDKSTTQAQIAYLPLSTTKTPSRLFIATLERAEYRHIWTTQNPPGLTPSGSKPKKGGISLTRQGKTNTPYFFSTALIALAGGVLYLRRARRARFVFAA